MLIMVMLLAMWPFHAKKKPSPAPPPPPPITTQEVPASACEKLGDIWFYGGYDNMIGISEVSCSEAHKMWQNLHIDPVNMSLT